MIDTTLLGQAAGLTISYDRADWRRVELLAGKVGIPEGTLPSACARAVAWVEGILRR